MDTKVIAHFPMHAEVLPRKLSTRLADLAAQFGIQYRAHDALEDARAAALVYTRLLALVASPT